MVKRGCMWLGELVYVAPPSVGSPPPPAPLLKFPQRQSGGGPSPQWFFSLGRFGNPWIPVEFELNFSSLRFQSSGLKNRRGDIWKQLYFLVSTV